MNQVAPSIFQSNLSCMSAKFSPLEGDKIAMVFADNFGVAGKGQVIIGQYVPGQPIKMIAQLVEHDSMFDCSWHETEANLLISGCGDGEIKLWDIYQQKVLMNFHESKDEVQSVEFSHKVPNLFLSSNMNGMTRLYDIQTQKVVQVFQTHKGCAYQATWHPIEGSVFATCGADGAMRMWDLKSNSNKNIASVKAHMNDVLSCDFNKYDEQIATCSVDKSIHIWDLRNLKGPVNSMLGHRHPVRRVKFSPHEGSILASASYDMSVCIWNTQEMQAPLVKMHNGHTEFVVSVDFSLHVQRQLASASWDGRVIVWQWDQEQPKLQ